MSYDNKMVKVFDNNEFGQVRTVVINNEPYFVGKDVADILGYKNPNEAIQDHVDKEDKFIRSARGREMLKLFSSVKDMQKELGRQDNWFINESGLYALVFGSKLPTAKKFKHWVTSEVLPTIRKTGGYVPQLTPNPHYRTRMIGTAVRDIGKTAEEIAKVFKVKTGMAMASAMAMVGDAYGIDTNPLRPLLPAEENPGYMNATAIAGKLGILNGKGKPDPKQVNLILESKGFQRKEGNDWRLNDAGTEYGEEKPYKHGNHSGYQDVWKDKVLYAFK